MIWFYPLNDIEISGYETFAVAWFMPVIFGVPAVLKFVQKRWILGILRICVVLSLASFQAPTTLTRLVTLALGNGGALLLFTANLWSPCRRIR